MLHERGPELNAADHEIVNDRLSRLADDLLCKSKDELFALAQCNPALVNEWLQEFRQRKLRADQEARLWATSASRLARALSKTLTDAAE